MWTPHRSGMAYPAIPTLFAVSPSSPTKISLRWAPMCRLSKPAPVYTEAKNLVASLNRDDDPSGTSQQNLPS
jgi:hypothetical protein